MSWGRVVPSLQPRASKTNFAVFIIYLYRKGVSLGMPLLRHGYQSCSWFPFRLGFIKLLINYQNYAEILLAQGEDFLGAVIRILSHKRSRASFEPLHKRLHFNVWNILLSFKPGLIQPKRSSFSFKLMEPDYRRDSASGWVHPSGESNTAWGSPL